MIPGNDFATIAGSPRPLTVGGRTYQVHPLTLGDLGRLQAWVESQFPDPVAIALRNCTDDVPVPMQKWLLSAALEQASKPRARIGTPEADAILNGVAGIQEFLFISISKGDPAFTRDDAARLFDAMTSVDIARAMQLANLDLVGGGGDPDPKATTAT